jgi:CheY-like chemotaxis protein
MTSGNVLIVDDSKAALFMLEKVLALSGINPKQITQALNGKDALHILQTDHSINLIITDINMPEMNGFELIEKIRKNPAWITLPIVIVTTEGREKYLQQAKTFNVRHFLKKPYHPEELKAILDDILEGTNHEESSIKPDQCDF